MTTILADPALGVMVSESNQVSGDRATSVRKVLRIRGALVASAGTVRYCNIVENWLREHEVTDLRPPKVDTDTSVLVLNSQGLWLYDESTPVMQRLKKCEAVGSGAIAALAAYEGLGYRDPVRAVRIACRHDPGSRPPVRLYHLDPANPRQVK